jgi:hypothetical protein
VTMQDVFAQDNDAVALAIIREPTDRFLSIYKYWKYGSDMYNRDNCKEFLRHDPTLCAPEPAPAVMSEGCAGGCNGEGGEEGMQGFMREWGGGHPRHISTISGRDDVYACGGGAGDGSSCRSGGHDDTCDVEGNNLLPASWPWYMWEAHFLPQTHWLNEEGARQSQVVLVRFTADPLVFAARIHTALAFLGAPVSREVQPIRVRNASRKPTTGAGAEGAEMDTCAGGDGDDDVVTLSEEDIRWLREEVFPGDFRLWQEAGEQARWGSGGGHENDSGHGIEDDSDAEDYFGDDVHGGDGGSRGGRWKAVF